MKIIKFETEQKYIYTYFELVDYNSWEDFDRILLLLTDNSKFSILDKITGIWSKQCILQKNKFIFKLFYHEDYGVCLCSENKETDEYYQKLYDIAQEIVLKIEKIK